MKWAEFKEMGRNFIIKSDNQRWCLEISPHPVYKHIEGKRQELLQHWHKYCFTASCPEDPVIKTSPMMYFICHVTRGDSWMLSLFIFHPTHRSPSDATRHSTVLTARQVVPGHVVEQLEVFSTVLIWAVSFSWLAGPQTLLDYLHNLLVHFAEGWRKTVGGYTQQLTRPRWSVITSRSPTPLCTCRTMGELHSSMKASLLKGN